MFDDLKYYLDLGNVDVKFDVIRRNIVARPRGSQGLLAVKTAAGWVRGGSNCPITEPELLAGLEAAEKAT